MNPARIVFFLFHIIQPAKGLGGCPRLLETYRDHRHRWEWSLSSRQEPYTLGPGHKAELCRLWFSCAPFLMQEGTEITATSQISGQKQIAFKDNLSVRDPDRVSTQSKNVRWGICFLSPLSREEGKCEGLRQPQSQESLPRHLQDTWGLGEGRVAEE